MYVYTDIHKNFSNALRGEYAQEILSLKSPKIVLDIAQY